MYCCPRQRSARSNGALVRCFGRNHCEDGCLTLVLSTVLAVLCFPVLLFQFASACAARRALRGRRGDCCLQLCSCGGATLYTSAQDDEDRAAFEASLRRRCVAAAGETRYAETKLRVVCLSDTHMQHASIRVPAGDAKIGWHIDGAVIANVRKDSLAEAFGVRPGDEITRANDGVWLEESAEARAGVFRDRTEEVLCTLKRGNCRVVH